MQTPASSIPRSPQQAINTMSPGDRRVLNENELAQRWGVSPKTLQRWRSPSPVGAAKHRPLQRCA